MRREHRDAVAQFERSVRADLRERRWLRVHALLLGTCCFLATWGLSTVLMHAGLDTLAARWALAVAGGYLVFLGLLRLWCRWLLSREALDDVPDPTDVVDIVDIRLPRGGRVEPVRPGQGGDFGGGGADAAYDAPVAEAGSSVAEGTGRALGHLAGAADADEAAVVVVPVAVVLAVAALIATAISVAVFGLFGVEVLLGVAVEIAIASAGGALAFRARREGWLAHAFGRTWKSALVLLALVVALGLVVAHWMPEARSLPHAVKLMRG